MARISRKVNKINTQQEDKAETAISTAIYARLSIEDNRGTADSIEIQVEIIKKYMESRQYLKLSKIFIDNGLTGTNFERPGFLNMMEAVKKGEVKCIIVKDLSRFGRNYIETGNFLENLFPFIGVRFVSVNDNYDSMEYDNNTNLTVSLKSILHDTYAKDISRKVCTSFDVKKKNGEFLGKYPPYGYAKLNVDKHKLVIDEQTAGIVRDIFKWRLEGFGVVAIAHKLNNLGIPSQFERHEKKNQLSLWRGSSIIGVLTNPNYIGCIIERKSDNALYKGKRLGSVPKTQWNLIENTHEPIIDKEVFEKVQLLIEESKIRNEEKLQKKSHRQRTENILKGLVTCGECGSVMVRDGGYHTSDGTLIRHRFGCQKKYEKKGHCFSKSIIENELLESVLTAIKAQIQILLDMNEILTNYNISNGYNQKKSDIKKQVDILNGNISNLKSKRNGLYTDYKEGLLSESSYNYAKEKYDNDIKQSGEKLIKLQTEKSNLEKNSSIKEEHLEKILHFKNHETISREMCLALIDKIVLYKGNMTIHYSYMDEYEKANAFLKQHVTGGKSRQSLLD